jgi:hypothetical protein
MNSVLTIVEQMLNYSIANNKIPVTGESKIKTALVTFSSLMAFLGIGFFVYGGYIWLSNNYDLVTVMFAMGVIFSFLSIACGILIYNIALYKGKKLQAEKENFITTAKEAFEIFQQELEAPVNDNPKTALLIASISGYLAGERFL